VNGKKLMRLPLMVAFQASGMVGRVTASPCTMATANSSSMTATSFILNELKKQEILRNK